MSYKRCESLPNVSLASECIDNGDVESGAELTFDRASCFVAIDGKSCTPAGLQVLPHGSKSTGEAMEERVVSSTAFSNCPEKERNSLEIAPCENSELTRESPAVESVGSATIPVVPTGIQWNEHKAGLAGVDKAKVQAVVTQMSLGSKYYAREQEKAAQLSRRIDSMQKEVRKCREKGLEELRKVVDSEILPEIEAQRVYGRVIACIDFDCFFSAVEALDDPSLVGHPHAVGGSSTGGVLSTASYEARKYGVRSAMALFIARKLCPQLKVLPVRFHRYKEISKLVAEQVLSKFDPRYRMSSLDEAFLDITHLITEEHTAEKVVSDLRSQVCNVTGGLTASVGVGPNCLVAKICADINKPNGQTIVLPGDERTGIIEFMSTLPIRKIPGVGKVLESMLAEGVGIKCVGDIFEERAVLRAVVGEKTLRFLLRSCLGIGTAASTTEADTEASRKGIGRERTFAPVSDFTKLSEILHNLCVQIIEDMKKAKVISARTISLKLKTSDFKLLSRSFTIPGGSPGASTAESIERYSKRLLKAAMPINLRLLGVRLNKLAFETSEADLSAKKDGVLKYFEKVDEKLDSSAVITMNQASDKIGYSKSPAKRIRPENSVERSKTLSKRPRNSIETMLQKSILRQPAQSKYACPVCNVKAFGDLAKLNSHVDECLNVTSDDFRKAIRESSEEFQAASKKCGSKTISLRML